MFHSAVLRLTIWYLVIIMLISLFFSVALYNVLTNELNRGLRRQVVIFHSLPFAGVAEPTNELENQINESKRNVQLNLVYFNVIILVFAGGASYLLAKRTLNPIEEIHDAQIRFTADASHELRTPMASMKTEIEVALRQKDLTSSETKEILKSNLEEIGKLEELSNGLLTLSNLQNVNKKEFFSECSLKEVVETSVKDVEKLARNRKVTIQFDLTETRLNGDQSSLTQLFRLLLDNAIKYSPEKTEIKITNFLKDNFVYIEIADQGFGIKATDLPHIFDRFYRTDVSRSKKEIPGYGLGLAIAKQIVETHNGRVEVASTPNKGSVFTLKLPVH